MLGGCNRRRGTREARQTPSLTSIPQADIKSSDALSCAGHSLCCRSSPHVPLHASTRNMRRHAHQDRMSAVVRISQSRQGGRRERRETRETAAARRVARESSGARKGSVYCAAPRLLSSSLLLPFHSSSSPCVLRLRVARSRRVPSPSAVAETSRDEERCQFRRRSRRHAGDSS